MSSTPSISEPQVPTMTVTEVPQVQDSQNSQSFLQKLGGSIMPMVVIAWVLAGIAAIVMSLVCFGFSGTMTEKILGIALAFFLGPLYFIFYTVNKDYCRDLGTKVTETVTQVVGGFRKRSE
jgi:hypothetical protein